MDYQYWEWTKKTRGLFWVKGSPGTGKSALMKYAATTMRYKQPGDLVIAYFIHGRGTDLQKSVLGVFRALLNNILAYLPQYLQRLTKTFKDREERYGSYQEKRWKWSVQDLQDCLLETLSKGAKDKHVIIFVDALDECGEHDAKALLSYFRDLTQQIVMEEGKVKICFSSRHYPILGSDNIPTVSVENQNGMDIQLVVHERLARIDPGERRQQIEQIEKHILRKSQGGFQWAVLVTDKILEGEMTGMKETNLLKMLTSIPETLDGLYGDILSSSNGAQKEQMVKLFQWILFARRPLSSQELREALVTDKDTASATINSLRRHDSWVEDLSQFEKYVKHLSRGLVEFQDRDVWEQHEPDGEPWNREAQFIHQSVADYLVEKFLTRGDEDQNSARSVAGAGHFELSRSCCRYITMGDVQDGASLPRGTLSVRFPLAPYAVQFLFRHIREVEREGFPQLDLLSLVQWDHQPKSLQQLAHLWTVLDPDHAHAPKGWPFIGATPLHILIAFGSQSAVNALLRDKQLSIDTRDSQGNTPLLLAIRESHHEMALMLLDRSSEWSQRHIRAVHENIDQHHNISQQGSFDVDVNATNDDGDTPLSMALTMTKAGELILRLIKAGANVEQWRQKAELFVYAIRNMDSALFMSLVTEYGSPDGAVYFISREISSGNEHQILKVFLSELLKAGAKTSRSWVFDGFSKTNNTDGHYSDDDPWDDYDDELYGDGDDDSDEDEDEEAILLASRKGQTSAVNLLLSHNISPNSSNSSGESPLTLAVPRGHIEIVKLLLENGANPNVKTANEQTPLILAVSEGDVEIVRLLLKNGADPKIVWHNGSSPLILAASMGNIEIVELLLENGAAGLNTANNEGNTPFLSAVSQGHTEIVELLLENGASGLDIKDSYGCSPLFRAASKGHSGMVELLLEIGASGLNIANKKGDTPLIPAVSNGHIEVVHLLLEYGADPDIMDEQGNTPLHKAAFMGHIEVVQLLLEKSTTSLNTPNRHGKTPFISAVSEGYIEMVELLLEKGATGLNTRNNRGNTPFIIAVSKGHVNIVKLLLEEGATGLNTPDRCGEVPLVCAILGNYLELVKLLLEQGADPNSTDYSDIKPLCIAVKERSSEAVEILLEKGADPNIKSVNGRTPLHLAVFSGHLGIIEVLLAGGANPNIADQDEQTQLHSAVALDRLDVIEVLLANGASLDIADRHGKTPLTMASAEGKFEIVELLLAKGANPDASCTYSKTPLISAAVNGHLEISKLLLAKGASLDAIDIFGRTPLFSAAANGQLEISRLLLAEGASLNAVEEYGEIPLIAAAANGHLEIVELFLAEGADPNATDMYGKTPLISAVGNGHLEICRLLLANGVYHYAIDSSRATALISAAVNGHLEICRLLLANGVSPNIDMIPGTTALIAAAANGYLEIVELLLAMGARPDLEDTGGRTAVLAALEEKHFEVACLLCGKNIDLNAADDLERLLLYLAWTNKHADLNDLLLLRNVNPDIISDGGWTPLDLAAAGGHHEVARVLLENGGANRANPNIAGKNGSRPLSTASARGHLGIVVLLLEKGAYVNATDDVGRTALYMAVLAGHLEIARRLVLAGADDASN